MAHSHASAAASMFGRDHQHQPQPQPQPQPHPSLLYFTNSQQQPQPQSNQSQRASSSSSLRPASGRSFALPSSSSSSSATFPDGATGAPSPHHQSAFSSSAHQQQLQQHQGGAGTGTGTGGGHHHHHHPPPPPPAPVSARSFDVSAAQISTGRRYDIPSFAEHSVHSAEDAYARSSARASASAFALSEAESAPSARAMKSSRNHSMQQPQQQQQHPYQQPQPPPQPYHAHPHAAQPSPLLSSHHPLVAPVLQSQLHLQNQIQQHIHASQQRSASPSSSAANAEQQQHQQRPTATGTAAASASAAGASRASAASSSLSLSLSSSSLSSRAKPYSAKSSSALVAAAAASAAAQYHAPFSSADPLTDSALTSSSSSSSSSASLSASSALLASISAATLAMSSRILPTVPSPQTHALHGQAQPPPLQQQQQSQQPRRAPQSLSYNAGRFSAGLASGAGGSSSSSASAQHTQFNLNSIDSMASHAHDLLAAAPHLQMWHGGHAAAPADHHASHQYASRAGAVSHHAHASASAPPELTNRRIASRNSGTASTSANPLTGGMGMNGTLALERAPSPANNMCEERIPLHFCPLSDHSLACHLLISHSQYHEWDANLYCTAHDQELDASSGGRLYQATLCGTAEPIFPCILCVQICHSMRATYSLIVTDGVCRFALHFQEELNRRKQSASARRSPFEGMLSIYFPSSLRTHTLAGLCSISLACCTSLVPRSCWSIVWWPLRLCHSAPVRRTFHRNATIPLCRLAFTRTVRVVKMPLQDGWNSIQFGRVDKANTIQYIIYSSQLLTSAFAGPT